MFNSILYVGQYSNGSTSKMRADILQAKFGEKNFVVINTDIPFNRTNRMFRSLGFRKKIGPLIKKVNHFILSKMGDMNYDIIWVDKAIYLDSKTTEILRSKAKKLVHFTPDPAFVFHTSRHFLKCITSYDFLITTKSYETEKYLELVPKNRLICVTQGYDHNLHRSYMPFEKREKAVVFVGHYEEDREEVLQSLIDNKTPVILAGIKWDSFVRKNQTSEYLTYKGSGIYGDQYVKLLNENMFALGSLSKWIPEKHTTRTFEIPACGTILLTEKNEEIEKFFTDKEVIFYQNSKSLVKTLNEILADDFRLKQIALSGNLRVHKDGRSYESIISSILEKVYA